MTPNTEEQSSHRGRQRNSVSCNECRSRKLRCDAQRPKCGFCNRSHLACEISPRGPRGPKRGHLNALRNRLAQLEQMLQNHETQKQQRQEFEEEQEQQNDSREATLPTPPVEGFPEDTGVIAYGSGMDSVVSMLEPQMHNPQNSVDLGSLFAWNIPPQFPIINATMHAELDQLYFDRVHPSIPIFHQQHYFSWSKSNTKTPSQSCLQHVMWILAILLSAQFHDLIEPLYTETTQKIDSIPFNGDSCDIELVQAWVLLATCELIRALYREAWISAGRAFRIVQALRYHEIDKPQKGPEALSSETKNVTHTEEKRRVFWMAYFLDHLLSMRNDWPVTLSEHTICTRLPIIDNDFQAGRKVLGAFLSEAMTDPRPVVGSTFNECLILVTICSRSLLCDQQNTISKAYGASESTWMEQRKWLEEILGTRLLVLTQCYSVIGSTLDPLLSFTHILAQATAVYLCRGVIELGGDYRDTDEMRKCQDQILTAVGEMVQFSKRLSELHISKIHPLMPIPLFVTAEFLDEHQTLENGAFLKRLQDLVEVMGNLKNVNNHDKSYLDLLPQSCISKSLEVLKHRYS